MTFSVLMSEEPNRFLPLVIVLLLAFVVPILLSRFQRVPVVVGEIVAGILVGPAFLGLVTETPILVFMQDIGLAFLMFLAGMEINLDQLLPSRNGKSAGDEPQVVSSALVVYELTLALALAAGGDFAKAGELQQELVGMAQLGGAWLQVAALQGVADDYRDGRLPEPSAAAHDPLFMPPPVDVDKVMLNYPAGRPY